MSRAFLFAALLAGLGACAGPRRLGLEADGAPPGRLARFTDGELRCTLELVPPSLRLTVENVSRAAIEIHWEELSIIGADHTARRIGPMSPPGTLDAGGTRVSEIGAVPWPSAGERLEVVLPTVVNGIPREYHFHVRTVWNRDHQIE